MSRAVAIHTEAAAAARHARYGKLPVRIRFEDMTEEVEAEVSVGANAAYDPERSWNYYSCLALDLGL
ncbi:hypothetical protein [Streptomyces sp. AcE210]|uniref:hypothetical protein n=1 Tax=Streptomyces sp. AcE210 TaxID=2292703 RepID=UPI000E305876|nr:hypothetical protein [Streptomyces sp. AcE210]RFC77843.1 hypothetical protein DXZ75_08380 [Streptomyces sp. AcE210]